MDQNNDCRVPLLTVDSDDDDNINLNEADNIEFTKQYNRNNNKNLNKEKKFNKKLKIKESDNDEDDQCEGVRKAVVREEINKDGKTVSKILNHTSKIIYFSNLIHKNCKLNSTHISSDIKDKNFSKTNNINNNNNNSSCSNNNKNNVAKKFSINSSGSWSQISKGFLRKKRSDIKRYDSTSTSVPLYKKKRFIILVFLLFTIIYLKSTSSIWDGYGASKVTVYHHSHVPGMKENSSRTLYDEPVSNTNNNLLPPVGYLVWSSNCKMPNLEIYNAEFMKYFKREKFKPCTDSQPLTNIEYNSTSKTYTLVVGEKLKNRIGNGEICSYQTAYRPGTGKKADMNYNLTKAKRFFETHELPKDTENIIITCKLRDNTLYTNAYSMVPDRPDVRDRLDEWKKNDTEAPISVLMLGIDSISRLNLIRAMPKTAQYLYDEEWFEMSGYNKVADNTFPNLMAILSGYNYSSALKICNPTKHGKLDSCPMIFYKFRDMGYVTGYGEDEETISTFNYLKVGFTKQPVDYYMRPFLLAAEHSLPKQYKSGLTFCLGFKHYGEYIFDYALEFAKNYKDDPFFGLFWTNTFSHNHVSDASSMDDKIVRYLRNFSSHGVVNRSAVIFFSDHGMRFGPTRHTMNGHYEERLPFFFISLPPWLKEKHPEFVNALNINKNRLTNPYDVHMTLKHILELSGRAGNLSQADGCPKCQTLLKPIPEDRSCLDANIEDHWCTCIPYKEISDKGLSQKIANFTLNYINDYILSFKTGIARKLCAKLRLKRISRLSKSEMTFRPDNSTFIQSYRINFTTGPGEGSFEATLRRYLPADKLEISGEISRINSYAKDSKCIEDGGAKKYCFCKKNPDKS